MEPEPGNALEVEGFGLHHRLATAVALGNSSRSVVVLRRSLPATVGLVAITSEARFGTALGLKSSASSLGQFLGPLVGGSMLAWRASSPYALAALTLLVLGALMAQAAVNPHTDERVIETDHEQAPSQ